MGRRGGWEQRHSSESGAAVAKEGALGREGRLASTGKVHRNLGWIYTEAEAGGCALYSTGDPWRVQAEQEAGSVAPSHRHLSQARPLLPWKVQGAWEAPRAEVPLPCSLKPSCARERGRGRSPHRVARG